MGEEHGKAGCSPRGHPEAKRQEGSWIPLSPLKACCHKVPPPEILPVGPWAGTTSFTPTFEGHLYKP